MTASGRLLLFSAKVIPPTHNPASSDGQMLQSESDSDKIFDLNKT